MRALIPARGGSKRVPGKNIKELGGKPLIQYTIDAAREILEDKNIIVSTDSCITKTTYINFLLITYMLKIFTYI
mgnify:CR=1 FL=1